MNPVNPISPSPACLLPSGFPELALNLSAAHSNRKPGLQTSHDEATIRYIQRARRLLLFHIHTDFVLATPPPLPPTNSKTTLQHTHPRSSPAKPRDKKKKTKKGRKDAPPTLLLETLPDLLLRLRRIHPDHPPLRAHPLRLHQLAEQQAHQQGLRGPPPAGRRRAAGFSFSCVRFFPPVCSFVCALFFFFVLLVG